MNEENRIDPLKHPRMSRENRAKQFAPFAALTGLEAALLAKELEAEAAAEPERGEAIEIP